MGEKLRATALIKNKRGLHARASAKIVLALRAFSKGLFRDTFVLKS